jgi:hypothetical protein
MGVTGAVLLEAPGQKTAAATANEDPGFIYIDHTKHTPTKKRSTPTKKDSSKKCVVNKDSIQ